MRSSVRRRLDGVHPKMLSASFAPESNAGEMQRNNLSPDYKRLLGQAIERALEHAGLTKQEASYRMGYENQTMLSRWISGIETPQFAKLWGLGLNFQKGLVIALAANCQVGVKVRTVIEVDEEQVSA